MNDKMFFVKMKNFAGSIKSTFNIIGIIISIIGVIYSLYAVGESFSLLIPAVIIITSGVIIALFGTGLYYLIMSLSIISENILFITQNTTCQVDNENEIKNKLISTAQNTYLIATVLTNNHDNESENSLNEDSTN